MREELQEEGTCPQLGQAVRDRIMRRFAAWLDETLAGERPPEGLDREILDRVMGEAAGGEPDEGADMNSVVCGLTALTTEVKLQGRAFKELCGALEPVAGHGEVLERIAAALGDACSGRVEGRVRAAEQRGRAALLPVLLDVRDRLERGLAQARRRLEAPPPAGLRHRLARALGRGASEEGEVLRALEEGYALGLARLDAALGGLGVEVLDAPPGSPFDPEIMNAVGVEETTECPEGTVREIYRTGYRWNGEVLRTAEVRVARSPVGGGESGGE